jgi:hypothetical protein
LFDFKKKQETPHDSSVKLVTAAANVPNDRNSLAGDREEWRLINPL